MNLDLEISPALSLAQVTLAIVLATAVAFALWWLAFKMGGENMPKMPLWVTKGIRFAVVTLAVIVGVGLLFFFAINRDKFE